MEKGTTLTRFIVEEERRYPEKTKVLELLSRLLSVLLRYFQFVARRPLWSLCGIDGAAKCIVR